MLFISTYVDQLSLEKWKSYARSFPSIEEVQGAMNKFGTIKVDIYKHIVTSENIKDIDAFEVIAHFATRIAYKYHSLICHGSVKKSTQSLLNGFFRCFRDCTDRFFYTVLALMLDDHKFISMPLITVFVQFLACCEPVSVRLQPFGCIVRECIDDLHYSPVFYHVRRRDRFNGGAKVIKALPTIDIHRRAKGSCYSSVISFLASRRHLLNQSDQPNEWKVLAKVPDVWRLIARHVYDTLSTSFDLWFWGKCSDSTSVPFQKEY